VSTSPVRRPSSRPLPAVETTARFVGPTDGTLRRLLLGLPAACSIATPRGETGYLLRANLDQGRVVGWRLTVCDMDRDDSGTTYDLPADLSGRPSCECRDFLYRSRRRADGSCKHLTGLRQLLEQIGLPC
jgi:hypothetical protein